MKRKAFIPLVLGLGIGLLAVKLAVDAVRRAQASNQGQQTVAVVMAKADIDAYTAIGPEMLELTEMIPNPLVPEIERIDQIDKLVGRVTGKSIPKGSPVLASMLAPEGTSASIAGRIPPGYRACAVKIDEQTSAGYQITPGDMVDVIVVMDIATGGRKKETIAEVILQNVEVAAVGYGNTPESEKGITKVKPAKSATLFVKEQDVPKLHLAGTRGKITLAMRGDDDTIIENPIIARGTEIGGQLFPDEPEPQSRPQPTPVTQNDLVASAQPVEYAPMPCSVMLVRGTSGGKGDAAIEQIVFENANSTKILELTKGAPSRAENTMRQPLPRPRAMQRNPELPTAPKEMTDNTEETKVGMPINEDEIPEEADED